MPGIILKKIAIEWLHDHKIYFDLFGNIKLKEGDYLNFNSEAHLEPYVSFRAGFSMCSMGSFSYSGSQVDINMSIGRYCSIAWGVVFNLPHHPYHHISTSLFTHGAEHDIVKNFLIDQNEDDWPCFPIQTLRKCSMIENDVWIGANVVINPGLIIGTGSVVAANSVVTKSISPYSIVGGNPAKLIKKRFDDDLINGLLNSQWWRYKFTDFKGMNFDDPSLFLQDFLHRKDSLSEFNPALINLSDLVYINEN